MPITTNSNEAHAKLASRIKLKKAAKNTAKHILLATVFLGSGMSYADKTNDKKESPWGISVGATSYLPEYKTTASDDNAGILLGVTYEGDNFHLTLDEAYYDIYKSSGISLSVLGRGYHQGYEDDSLRAFNGMEERDLDVGLGIRAAYSTPYGEVVATATSDIAGAHDSAVYALGYSYTAHMEKLTIVPSAKVTKFSSDYMNYYYGVKASETTTSRAAYSAKGGSVYTLGITASYAFDENWSVTGQVNQNFLPDTIKNSSLTRNENSVTSGLIAINYAF